ncbi:MAG: bifunctional 5,10-methylenetetrahydrofolate dehydrogenase/5,10-methenyltetrahydrofolate cyclohydrolase [Candidatus Liptonbacteria bacterium]|nr:bifunctional 5,10-methylenetetrahydrofolate dehydrogenase/5,10-methenyltetrahydrofolate cyclohydrolase [Candidatus Liptonbacteria bacterium]
MIIDGTRIAEETIARLKGLPQPDTALAAVHIGTDAASRSFLRQKERVAKELGVEFRLYRFDAALGSSKLRRAVARISKQAGVGGMLVQLPLPAGLHAQSILNAIDIRKDLECLTSRGAGEFMVGRSRVLPPAVAAFQKIADATYGEKGKLRACRAAIVGAGRLVGLPVAHWLMGCVRELAVFDVHTPDMPARLKDFDIIVSGVGQRAVFSAADVKEGALVVDFGYDAGHGDFDPAGADARNISYTPTPGGTGPVVVAALIENFYALSSPTASP